MVLVLRLVLLFALVACVSALFDSKPYDKISKHLDHHVKTDDVQANLDEAKQWYEQSKNKRGSFNGYLLNYTRLSECLEEQSCGPVALEIIDANSAEYVKTLNPRKPIKRAQKVFKAVVSKHSQMCRPIYLNKYKEIIQNLDQNNVKRVAKIFSESYYDAYIKYMFSGHLSEPFEELIVTDSLGSLGSVKDELDIRKFYLDAMREDLQDAETSNNRFEEVMMRECTYGFKRDQLDECRAKLTEMFKKSVQEPCKQFINELGPNVFEPHDRDLSWAPETVDRTGSMDKPTEYQLGWFRYIMCLVTEKQSKHILSDMITKLLYIDIFKTSY